jgi:predicted RNA binding protein YcfA (HicA-like mRNA interferase family)
MPELPRVTAKEIIKILERCDFHFARQSGSHKIYKNKTGKRVTVPFHADKILHPKITKSIVRDLGISIDDFIKLL